jgi:uncharacterized membrane protein YbhN (UPF0104 family)
VRRFRSEDGAAAADVGGGASADDGARDAAASRFAARLRVTRERLLFVVALSALLEAAAAVVLLALVGWDRLTQGLRLGNIDWFAFCLVGAVGAWVGYVLAFRAVARVGGGPRVGFLDSAAVVSAGFAPLFMVNVAGGFAIDRAALEASGANRREAASRVVALNALEYAVLAPAAAVSGVLLALGITGSAPAAVTLPWLAVIPGAALAGWLVHSRLGAWLQSLRGGNIVSRTLAYGVAGLALLWQMLTQPRRHLLAIGGIALYWAGEIFALSCALAAFDAHPGIPALVLAYATGYALTRRALPLGGPGAVEVLLPLALAWVHTSFAGAFAAVLVYRFFNFWLALVPGLVVLAGSRRLAERLARVGRHG